MNNALEGIHSRITEAEEWINDLEDRTVEITATEQNIEKRMKRNEDSWRQPKRPLGWHNIHIIGIPQGEERQKGPQKIFGDNSWKLPLHGKEIVNASPGSTESQEGWTQGGTHQFDNGHQTDKN